MRFGRLVVLVAVIAAVVLPQVPAPATHGVDVEVSNGSNDAVFSQNKQNEPTIGVDPAHPNILVAGANDNIDLEGCNVGADNTCPFTQGVGVSGVYFSFDSGDTWQQPSYTGYSARSCLGVAGTSDDTCSPLTPQQGGQIGTLPWYYENGIVSDGDPAVAFGPAPSSGGFAWSNGSRLYYANLTSSFSTKRTDAGFKGVEAIGVSRTDIPAAGMSAPPAKGDWKQPVVVTAGGSSAGFADKEQIWADNYERSPYFGNAYLCFGDFVGGPSAGSNTVREIVGRSTNGGDTWSTQVVQKNTTSSSGAYAAVSGTSGCTIRTDGNGNVYVFWVGFNQQTKTQGIYLTRSFDGGVTYEKPRQLFPVVATGVADPLVGRNVMDGIAGARADLSVAPAVDIANNSVPNASGAPSNRIVMVWVDGADGLNHEHLKFSTSTNSGVSWSAPQNIERPGDRPLYTAPAISPSGRDVYVVYNTWTEPYKNTRIGAAGSRTLEGVLLHADSSEFGVTGFGEIFRSAPGDARGSSQNNLQAEFLGDYVYAVARHDYVAAVWNDVRDAADCPAIDAYLMSLENKDKKDDLPAPAPQQQCPPNGSKVFGNSSIYGVSMADPTP